MNSIKFNYILYMTDFKIKRTRCREPGCGIKRRKERGSMDYRIYLAGGMADLSWDGQYRYQYQWRAFIKRWLGSCDSTYRVKVCNPVDYYNFENPTHESDREVMDFDLDKVRHSDLLLINFDEPHLNGMIVEQAIAYEHRIPVIGLNEKRLDLHPWQVGMANRIFYDMDEMLNYVKDYYLN